MRPPELVGKGLTDIGQLRPETAKSAKRFEGGAEEFIEVFDNALEYIIMSPAPTRYDARGFLTTFGQM